jgi:hypothetical protein
MAKEFFNRDIEFLFDHRVEARGELVGLVTETDQLRHRYRKIRDAI